MLSYRAEDNCWFYASSAVGRDCAAEATALRAGTFRMRDGELVVKVDEGATYYVMPCGLHDLLTGAASESALRLAATRTKMVLPCTAVHKNAVERATGARQIYYTFGNLPGASAVLFGETAHPDLSKLAGRKLANVRIQCHALAQEAPSLSLFTWELRAQ